MSRPELCTLIDLISGQRRFDRDTQPPRGWCIKNFAGKCARDSGRSELFLVKLLLSFPKTPSGVTCLALLEKPRQIMRNSTGHSQGALKTRVIPMSPELCEHTISSGQQQASMQNSGICHGLAMACLPRASAGSQEKATIRLWRNGYSLRTPCGFASLRVLAFGFYRGEKVSI
ncbi:MAG: hypothetical protein ONB48_20540 [candidate division KSB1 bacterium]|nr:hypothetical protein [candidate division KSB1 bacterium]MDZ7273374.1 hypothetical protein [candidate division KSB1 bacterium]MDZ7288036.1 hypothetical protein [candidate division KSB1 bacterium]MDZ7300112.1 hypothetical protein [candidate division KSB1 bacterium]MDZ7308937.1 hypothetical protein [candidate division KSB1 bacterium]